MCSFKFQIHQNPFSAGAVPRTSLGVYDAPQIPIQLGRGHREVKYPQYGYFSSPKAAEARQTCPGFFLKSLLESRGNLLD